MAAGLPLRHSGPSITESSAFVKMTQSISLFQGYVLLRVENLVAPGLVHTFANWVGTLANG